MRFANLFGGASRSSWLPAGAAKQINKMAVAEAITLATGPPVKISEDWCHSGVKSGSSPIAEIAFMRYTIFQLTAPQDGRQKPWRARVFCVGSKANGAHHGQ